MDCITEAKKFIKRAQEAHHPEVIYQHLAMADWYLSEAMKEQNGEAQNGEKENPAARDTRT
jgi:hypothetical protein